jgi:hypothetical protein
VAALELERVPLGVAASPAACEALVAAQQPAAAAASCQEHRARDPSSASGIYEIDLGDLGAVSVYCDMDSNDGYGWTKVIGVDKSNRNHCTDEASAFTDPGASGFGKLSDAHINRIIGPAGILRAVETDPTTNPMSLLPIYFRKSGASAPPWDFNGASEVGYHDTGPGPARAFTRP